MALDYLASELEAERMVNHEAVWIFANGSASMFWLYTRLQTYATSEIAHSVSVVTTDVPADLLDPTLDLVIYYGRRLPAEWEGVKLFDKTLVPVAAPSISSVDDEEKTRPVLDYPETEPDWISWRRFLLLCDATEFSENPVEICLSYVHSIDRAMAGQRVALGSTSILNDVLDGGSLVVIGDEYVRSGRRHWLAWPKTRELRESVKQLSEFLQRYSG